MASDKNTALQTSESTEMTEAEGTRPGNLVSPAVDIFENQEAITVLADMPGVAANDLSIDLHEGVLTITGHVTSPESEVETDVFREYRFGTFQRKFTLSETIDQNGIEAKLSDGVLHLQLPRAEKAKSRKIEVRTS